MADNNFTNSAQEERRKARLGMSVSSFIKRIFPTKKSDVLSFERARHDS